jgi:hypothetical protein
MAHGDKGAQLTMLDRLQPDAPAPAKAAASDPSGYIEPSAETFRICCEETLAMLRASAANPWNPLDARYYRVLFRLRSEWLSEEEGAALRAEFAEHWQRLGVVEVPLETRS